MTRQEVRLWLELRRLKEEGRHFRRQVPRAGFILDFACLREKVAIEVDGGAHGTYRVTRDRVRDTILEAAGFRVLRFWNDEVDNNLDGVLVVIREAVGLAW